MEQEDTNFQQKSERAISTLRIVILSLFAAIITILFFQVISNFIIAIIFAIITVDLMNPAYLWIERKTKGKKAIASALTVILVLLIVIIPLVFFLGTLVHQAMGVSESATRWVASYSEHPIEWNESIKSIPFLDKLVPYQDEILKKMGEFAGSIGRFAATGLASGAKSTVSFGFSLFVMLYAMFCFFIDGPKYKESIFKVFPLTSSDKEKLINTFVSVSRATLKGTIVIGLVQGTLAGASFALAGVQGSIFWGAIMVILSIIPGIGISFVWIPVVIYLMMNGQVKAAIGVGLWCSIVAGSADNFLRPILVGREAQMPDLLILLTTMGGLVLFGASGIVLGPLVGALFITIWNLLTAATQNSISKNKLPAQ